MCAQWPANGATDWNTKMLAYLAVEHKTDGKHDITDGGSPTLLDSEANAMLKVHAYKAQGSGFVTAFSLNDQAALIGYVGATSDPAGAGTKVAQTTVQGNVANDAFISFFVGKNKYFEVTATGTPTITWTSLNPSVGAPVDFS